MYITRLTLKNFRNYREETFEFSDGFNILVGKNAQGKTNAVEAVFLLSTGYSPRAAKDKQVIFYGEESAFIEGEAANKYGKRKVSIAFSKNDKKQVKINSTPVLRMGELMGNINSVFFNPSELKLIQESPEDRRRFMDISLSQMSKQYFYALQKYKKILEQRNKLLKDWDKSLIRETLPIWDEQMSKHAAKIILMRNEFIKSLAPKASEAHAYVSGGEILSVETDYKYEGDEEEIASSLMNVWKDGLARDLALGFTYSGPHRDDLKITINGEDVRTYGSQGQQRNAALSLKIAETDIFYERFGEYPILILDDFMSELDLPRQKRLLERVGHMQTLITCTHLGSGLFSDKKYKKFNVSAGKIAKITEK